MLPIIIEEQGLGATLPLIITGPWSDGIDVSPISFHLWMDGGVPVDFRGRGLKDLRFEPFGKSQHVDGAMDIDFGRLDRIVLVMDRRGGTGEIVNFIHLDVEGKGDVVAEEFKIRVPHQMNDVFLCSRVEIIHAKDIIALFYETFAEMGTEKTGASGDQDTNPILIFQGRTPIGLIWFVWIIRLKGKGQRSKVKGQRLKVKD